jgi:hypothetical protein
MSQVPIKKLPVTSWHSYMGYMVGARTNPCNLATLATYVTVLRLGPA